MSRLTSNKAFYPELEDLQVGQQFVFYSSLLGATEEFNPYAHQTGIMARDYLYKSHNILNPQSDTEASVVMQQAMFMLEKAWQFEEAKERYYINYLAQKFPESTIFKKTNIDFMDLILELNRIQKGAERAQQYIDYERKRWSDYREYFEEIEAKKEDFVKTKDLDKDDPLKKEAAGQYHAARSAHLGQSLQRKIGALDSEFFTSLDKNKNAIVNILKDVVINKFGSDLFIYKKDGLQIDYYKTAKLINVLIKMIYEQLLISSAWKGVRSSSRKRNAASKVADTIFGETDNSRRAILDSLKKTSIGNEGIDELRQHLTSKQQKEIAERMKANQDKLKPLIHNLKNLYRKETGVSKIYEASFKKWMKSKGYDDNYEEQLLRELSIIENIKVDIWFESEESVMREHLIQGLDAVLNGNKHNLKSDIEAGQLVIEISVDTNTMNKEVSKAIRDYEQKLWTTQQSFIQNMKVGADKKSYEQNYNKFVLARQEQLKILDELETLLRQQQIDVKDVLTYFNVHTSVKDQTGNLYLDKGSGFTGGAVGRDDSALSFIDNVNKLYQHSGYNLSTTDLAWLKNATLNAGKGLIGSRNKNALEGYFSMFVNFLMFDDAYNIVEDSFSDYLNNLQGNISVQDIHLYVFNGIYVPLSYMLKSIWNALKAFSKDMHRYTTNLNTGAARVSLTTYNVSGYPGYTEQDWKREAQNARDNTKIKVVLMSGFLDLLNQLNEKLQNPI